MGQKTTERNSYFHQMSQNLLLEKFKNSPKKIIFCESENRNFVIPFDFHKMVKNSKMKSTVNSKQMIRFFSNSVWNESNKDKKKAKTYSYLLRRIFLRLPELRLFIRFLKKSDRLFLRFDFLQLIK